MKLNICKVIALIVLTVISLTCALIPLKIRKITKLFRSKNERKDSILTVMQCFGGGLLLGIALILILPEIQMELQSLGIESKSIPLAELLLSAGFFIVYLIEELFTFALPESHKYMSHIQTFAEEQDENENNEVPVTSTPVKQSKPNDSDMGIDTVDISLDAITSTSAAEDSANPDNSFTSFNPKYAGSLNSSTQSMFPNYRPNVEASKVQRSTLKHNFQLPKMPSLKLDKTDGSTGSMVKTWTRQELVATVLLSFYSLIEGLVVGLATSHVNLWQLFAVILVYQIIKSFNLGIAMSIGKSSLLSLLLISFSTCLGVGIGIGVASVPSVTQLLIVKGVAAGALLYVVIVEVIHQEKSKEKLSGLLQFGSLLFGFIITVLIKILSSSEMTSDDPTETPTELPPPIVG